jgi:hypothetical protein
MSIVSRRVNAEAKTCHLLDTKVLGNPMDSRPGCWLNDESGTHLSALLTQIRQAAALTCQPSAKSGNEAIAMSSLSTGA